MNQWALNRADPSQHNKELHSLDLSPLVLRDLEIIQSHQAKYTKDTKIMMDKFERKASIDNNVDYFKNAEDVSLFLRFFPTAPNKSKSQELQRSSMWTSLQYECWKINLDFGKKLYEDARGEHVLAYPLSDVVPNCLRMYMERKQIPISGLAPKTPFKGYMECDTRALHPDIAANLVTLGIIKWTGCKLPHGRKPNLAAIEELNPGVYQFDKTIGEWWMHDVCRLKEHVPQS